MKKFVSISILLTLTLACIQIQALFTNLRQKHSEYNELYSVKIDNVESEDLLSRSSLDGIEASPSMVKIFGRLFQSNDSPPFAQFLGIPFSEPVGRFQVTQQKSSFCFSAKSYA